MKKLIMLFLAIVLITVGVIGYARFHAERVKKIKLVPPTSSQSHSATNTTTPQEAAFTTIATGLEVPWALAFLPNGDLLVTERIGDIKIIRKNTGLEPTPLLTIPEVKQLGEGGLMGIAIHPDYPRKPYVYLYYTYGQSGNLAFNRLVRYKFENEKFSDAKILLENIPASSNHDGGRIKFGPDKLLYITTGDSEAPSLAQDRNSLAGKILRLTDEGKPATENPFASSEELFNPFVYSYGHRNPQGLAWDSTGKLWETEHGRSNPTGFDETNHIEPGKNYGWPTIQGDETRPGMETPVRNSGSTTTWAPSGAVFVGDSLFFAGLRGETLYEAVIKNNQVTEFKEHFKGQFGRLREVVLGSDGLLYITTSNRDGRGNPESEDDRVIRVNPEKL